ncbi:hypothetical protein [Spirillospora sp. CA-294931]|uniref:hypothetical protein n=1 Tax=Spirillospora sp. CA-294931 TaxID=3240042 RepID=UPI003D8E708C
MKIASTRTIGRVVPTLAAAAMLAGVGTGIASAEPRPELPAGAEWVDDGSGCSLAHYNVCAYLNDSKTSAIGLLIGAENVKLAGRYDVKSWKAREGIAVAWGPTNGWIAAACLRVIRPPGQIIEGGPLGLISVLGHFRSSLRDPDRNTYVKVDCGKFTQADDDGKVRQTDGPAPVVLG